MKRKLTRRERFKGAVQRGVSKIKKTDEESMAAGGFTLDDDVKDFLAGRSSTSSEPKTLQSSPPDQKASSRENAVAHNDVEDFLRKPAAADALPPFPSPSRAPKPRIDVSRSPRFPSARHLEEDTKSPGIVSASRVRSRSHSPPRQKSRRKGLAVRFTSETPIIIGEGGDEAEAPTSEISRARARSHSPMPGRMQEPSRSPQQQIVRKPIASSAQRLSPQHISPMSAQSLEFEMSLAPGFPKMGSPASAGPEASSQARIAASVPLRSVKAPLRSMRAEEGKTLRESFGDSSDGSIFD